MSDLAMTYWMPGGSATGQRNRMDDGSKSKTRLEDSHGFAAIEPSSQSHRESLMFCEVCSQPARIHAATILPNGKEMQRHYCESHAPAIGSRAAAIQILLSYLRKLREFVGQHGRLPGEEENCSLGGQGSLPSVGPEDDRFKEGMAHVERLIGFVEGHQRLPRADEMPLHPRGWFTD